MISLIIMILASFGLFGIAITPALILFLLEKILK